MFSTPASLLRRRTVGGGRALAAWVLTGMVVGGCGGERAGGPEVTDERSFEQRVLEEAIHPEYREEEEEQRLVIPGELAQLRPAAVLPAGEQRLVWPLNGPALVRIARQGGQGNQSTERVVAELEAESGQLLLVDRRQGVKLAGDQVVPGPLERTAAYAVYLLPPGGVRQEAVLRRYRPATPEEIRAAQRERREAEAAEQAQRRAEQGAEQAPGTATQPTGPQAAPPPQ